MQITAPPVAAVAAVLLALVRYALRVAERRPDVIREGLPGEDGRACHTITIRHAWPTTRTAVQSPEELIAAAGPDRAADDRAALARAEGLEAVPPEVAVVGRRVGAPRL
jgi:hypothetical protein